MKIFDPYAALAKIEKQGSPPATSATLATQTTPSDHFVAEVAGVATSKPEIVKNVSAHPEGDMRHGFSVSDRPKTWTGKVVSLEAWQQLSDWEKHGPGSRVWNGATKKWEGTS